MSKFIPKGMWAKYERIINNFIDNDAGQQEFLWLRHNSGALRHSLPLPHGEDRHQEYTPIKLKGLFHYNYIRTWPYNLYSPSGALDNTSTVLYISRNQLDKLGYVNDHGAWVFDNILDRFILKGTVYKPSGDTPVAQMDENSLLYFVVLQVEDIEESRKLTKEFENYLPIV